MHAYIYVGKVCQNVAHNSYNIFSSQKNYNFPQINLVC
jgi:hypothetical protein